MNMCSVLRSLQSLLTGAQPWQGAVSSVPAVPRRKLRRARGLDPGHTSEQLGAKVQSQGICLQILCFPRFLGESGPDRSGRGVPLTISRAASLTLPRAACA